MTNRHIVARAPDFRQGSTPRPNPASTGRRMKRNVRVGDRRTTIVLEAYVWDCIDSMLHREDVTLDAFCNMIEGVRRSSSMASSARLIVLAYFRLLGQINTPPLLIPISSASSKAVHLNHSRRQLGHCLFFSLLSGALRKTKRMVDSGAGGGHLSGGGCH